MLSPVPFVLFCVGDMGPSNTPGSLCLQSSNFLLLAQSWARAEAAQRPVLGAEGLPTSTAPANTVLGAPKFHGSLSQGSPSRAVG